MAKLKFNQNNSSIILNDQLFHAAVIGDLQAMKRLIVLGADINYVKEDSKDFDNFDTPVIVIAALNRKFEAVKLLVENNAAINVERDISLDAADQALNSSPLMQAIMAKRDDIVEFLLNKNASPNYLNSYKKYYTTPLSEATFKGQTKIVKLLLEHKANPYLKDSAGRTTSEYLHFLIEIREPHLTKQNNTSEIEALLLSAMNNFDQDNMSVEITGLDLFS